VQQRLYAIKESGWGIGRDRDGRGAQVDLVRLFGDGLLVGVQRVPDADRSRREHQRDRTVVRRPRRCDMKPRTQSLAQADGSSILGGNALALDAPAGAEAEVATRQGHALRRGQHGVTASPERRQGSRRGANRKGRDQEGNTRQRHRSTVPR